MKPVEFKGQNVIYGKDQPEYQPLPAMRLPDGTIYTCWELSEDELKEVMETRKIYVSQLTFNQPIHPILLMTDLSSNIELT